MIGASRSPQRGGEVINIMDNADMPQAVSRRDNGKIANANRRRNLNHQEKGKNRRGYDGQR